jgi:hypothetical protein
MIAAGLDVFDRTLHKTDGILPPISQLIARLGRGDGNGHDDAARALLSQGCHGCVHRGPGREPVIDENHCPATHIGARTIASVQTPDDEVRDLLARSARVGHPA